MGQSSLESPACLIMKMFVVLALAAVAVAEPEADPQVLLSGAYSSPLVRSLTPVTYTRPVSGYTYSSYSPYVAYNPTYHPIVKRDADADAEADPAVVYPTGVYTGLSYTGVPTMYTGLHTTYAGTPVVKPNGAAHAVAVTPFGVAHSSHVGVCTNNNGEQVSC